MILVIDLCYQQDSLSRSEFVSPIKRIIQRKGTEPVIRHYTSVSQSDLETADAAILCGTALKDSGFMKHSELFKWIIEFKRPMLGISSGMLAIVTAFGGTIDLCLGIGMTDIRVIAPDPLFAGKEIFEGYELHEYAAQTPSGFIPLALSDRYIQAIRHQSLSLYGLLFHPEVRNEWIIERFLERV